MNNAIVLCLYLRFHRRREIITIVAMFDRGFQYEYKIFTLRLRECSRSRIFFFT